MRVVLNASSNIEWQCLGNGRILDRVASAPLLWQAGQDYSLAFSWAGGAIALFVDGREVVRRQGCAIPARLGDYFFIGSDEEGTNTLNGWIKDVTVALDHKPVKGLLP